MSFIALRENPVQRVGFLYAILLAGRGGSMGVREVGRLRGGLLYTACGSGDSYTVPFENFILFRFIQVFGERSRFDVDAVLIQLFSKVLGTEAALFHVSKCRIKGSDSLSERHFVVAFERLFLVLEIGKFRQNAADSLSIGFDYRFILSTSFSRRVRGSPIPGRAGRSPTFCSCKT